MTTALSDGVNRGAGDSLLSSGVISSIETVPRHQYLDTSLGSLYSLSMNGIVWDGRTICAWEVDCGVFRISMLHIQNFWYSSPENVDFILLPFAVCSCRMTQNQQDSWCGFLKSGHGRHCLLSWVILSEKSSDLVLRKFKQSVKIYMVNNGDLRYLPII